MSTKVQEKDLNEKEVFIKDFDPKNDAAFKAIMASPNNREMVVDVLHAFTNIPKEDLRSATFIAGEEIVKKNMKEKGQRTDFTIKIASHMQIILEMNDYWSKHIFDKNTLYGLSRVVENTTSKQYASITVINIDNFNEFNTDKPLLTFKLMDEDGHIESEVYTSIHFILENCQNKNYNIPKELEKFNRFLKQYKTIEELENEFRGDEKYMAAIRTVKELSTDPE